MNLSIKRLHLPSRRDGSERLEREINDIMTLLAFCDEQKVFDNLPVCVNNNPDNMPSLRLFDGDTHIILKKKFNEIDTKLSEFGSGLAAVAREIRALQVLQPPVLSCMNAGFNAARDINTSSAHRAATDPVVPIRAAYVAGRSDLCWTTRHWQ